MVTRRIALLTTVVLVAWALMACGSGGSSATDGHGQRIADQGAVHIAPGQDHPPYNSAPATSGWHLGQPLAPAPWGVHDEVLRDEVLVHNLEHGGTERSAPSPTERVTERAEGKGRRKWRWSSDVYEKSTSTE